MRILGIALILFLVLFLVLVLAPDSAGASILLGVSEPCSISVTEIDFGTVYRPGWRDTSITLINTADTTLSGEANMTGAMHFYSFLAGSYIYSLEPGEQHVVLIRYLPRNDEEHVAALHINASCPSIPLRGEGAPGLSIYPSSLNFGTVLPGSTVTRTFQVTNISPVRLPGHITTSCGDFRLASQQVSYLEPGQSRMFTLAFTPSGVGYRSCSFYFDSLSIFVYGSGSSVCNLSPIDFDFGAVALGDTTTTTFAVTNYALIPITTSVYTSTRYPFGGHFSVAGANKVTVPPKETVLITVRYHPQDEGESEGAFKTGRYTEPSCGSANLRGEGYRKCAIARSSSSFGEVVVGESRIRSFSIYPLEDKPVKGFVRFENCYGPFSFASGGGSFHLEPGEVHTFEVKFAPWGQENYSCLVQTGLECGEFMVSGGGVFEPLPQSHPDAGFSMEVRPHSPRFGCRVTEPGEDVLTPCTAYRTAATTQQAYFVYLVLTGGNPELGFAGADFGIEYKKKPAEGIDVFTWASCGDLEFPTTDWPQSGSGNLLTWNHEDNCQRELVPGQEELGVHATLGAFYLYAYSLDVLKLTPRTHVGDQGPHVSDCLSWVNVVETPKLGTAVFTPVGDIPGCNPCLQNCVERDPMCTVYPPSIDFGPVGPETFTDTTMYVLNPFDFAISGRADIQSPEFSIIQGGAKFTLEPGEIHTFIVRFTPPDQEVVTGQLSIPPLCTSVLLQGGGLESEPTDPPVPVRITGLQAGWSGRTGVLQWEVLDSADHLGFHVYRQEGFGGERIQLSRELQQGQSHYRFADPTAPRDGADYWLAEQGRDGSREWYGPTSLSPYTGPTVLALAAGRPNPFRSRTTMEFQVPSDGPVTLSVFNLTGREVVRLVDGFHTADTRETSWDGRDSRGRTLPAGIYLIRLATVNGVRTRKLVKVN